MGVVVTLIIEDSLKSHGAHYLRLSIGFEGPTKESFSKKAKLRGFIS